MTTRTVARPNTIDCIEPQYVIPEEEMAAYGLQKLSCSGKSWRDLEQTARASELGCYNLPANMPPKHCFENMRLPDNLPDQGIHWSADFPNPQIQQFMSATEKEFCRRIRLAGDTYLRCRQGLFDAYHNFVYAAQGGSRIPESRGKVWNKSQAQKVKACPINVNNISHMWAFYDVNGFWQRDWRSVPT